MAAGRLKNAELKQKSMVALLALALTGLSVGQESLRLVKDINLQPTEFYHNVTSVTAVGERIYFTAQSPEQGVEMWTSNGTSVGTHMVKDILPGVRSSVVQSMMGMGGKVYFSGYDDEHGAELWASDGTEAGTALVKDLTGDVISGNPSPVAASADHLWFMGRGPDSGSQVSLWATDGSAAGSVELNPPVVPEGGGAAVRRFDNTSSFAVLGDILYFAANGSEIWKSDGTAEGTVLVQKLLQAEGVSIRSITVVEDRFILMAYHEETSQHHLWRGTGQAGSFVPVEVGVRPLGWYATGNLITAGKLTYFLAADPLSIGGLWRSDGTAEGTFLLQPTLSPNGIFDLPDLTAVGPDLYFAWASEATGTELWKTDGTDLGTQVVKDIVPGPGDSAPTQLLAAGNRLYFAATTEKEGQELWSSDGTKKGTRRVIDLTRGADGSYPGAMAAIGKIVYFPVNNLTKNDGLWRTNGSAAGTRALLRPEPGNDSGMPTAVPVKMAEMKGRVYFRGNDGKRGEELWSTDGTPKGTRMLRDIMPGGGDSKPTSLTPLGDRLIFTARTEVQGWQLWSSDGSARGTRALTAFTTRELAPSPLVVVGNTCCFLTANPNGNTLWRTDGTPQGTQEIRPGGNVHLNAVIGEQTQALMGGSWFFTAHDGTTGQTLWRTDGTEQGTTLIKETGVASRLTTVGNRLAFFVQLPAGAGFELWTSDGTEAGTLKVPVELPAVNFTQLGHSAAIGGLHLFFASDGSHGFQLWRSDGTAAGTRMVRDDVEAGEFGYDTGVRIFSAAAGRQLFFVANDKVHGAELWVTDGTAAGTRLTKDLMPALSGSLIRELVPAGDKVYFNAYEPSRGMELWSSDGTATGTVVAAETMPGELFTSPVSISVIGSRLYFGGQLSGGRGWELHYLEWEGSATGLAASDSISHRDSGKTSPDSLGSGGENARALLRSAFNLDPHGVVQSVMTPGSGISGFPCYSMSGGVFRVEFLRRRNAGMTYTPKCSATLDPASFVPMSGTESVTLIDGEWERVLVEQAVDVEKTPRLFGVVEVTGP